MQMENNLRAKANEVDVKASTNSAQAPVLTNQSQQPKVSLRDILDDSARIRATQSSRAANSRANIAVNQAERDKILHTRNESDEGNIDLDDVSPDPKQRLN